MNDITKIVPALENSNILLKGITKTVENEAGKKGFLRMLLGTLGTNLLRSMLTGKEWKRILRAVCWSGPSIIDLRF